VKAILYAAVDVDDHAFHVAVINNITDECEEFECKPTSGALATRIRRISQKSGLDLRLCYEATYLGFSLCRELLAKGVTCEIIAPSEIPVAPGQKQKTDRIDARKLAVYYAKGLLTTVHIPDETEEMDRSLLRSRKFLVEQMAGLKTHVTALCRRLGFDYRQETGMRDLWTKRHIQWISVKAKGLKGASVRVALVSLLKQFEDTIENIGFMDLEIEHLANTQRYVSRTKALTCYRGIDITSAMTLITEIGDIFRFDHPRRLTAYAGLDLIESSSGGKEHRFGIAKTGSRHIRTTLVESCQFALQPVRVGRTVAERRVGTPPELVDIADRCMVRLHKKGTKLLYRGKQRNKITVACAREMLGFVWESLRKAA
jgi:transposase